MARIDFESYETAPLSGANSAMRDVQAAALLNRRLDCSTGRNGASDLVLAHKWFNLAALKGNNDAQRYRQEIAQEMDQAEIAKAQRAAREWLRTH